MTDPCPRSAEGEVGLDETLLRGTRARHSPGMAGQVAGMGTGRGQARMWAPWAGQGYGELESSPAAVGRMGEAGQGQ